MARVNSFICLAALVAACWAGYRLWLRVELSLAKHRSLEGHPRWSRRLAHWLPHYEYGDADFFRADGAPADVSELRRQAFERLAAHYRQHHAKSAELGREAAAGLSDLQLTARNRVPFQFSRRVRESLGGGLFVTSTEGMTLTDVDGNVFIDLTGSYGVNVFGNDFYKGCIERGSRTVRDLGPVLGALHPVVLDNLRRLRAISGMDEISFHMSGTEAVMQAVRLARYHTRRRYAVRFCGAYHGWWGDMQPGIGNPLPARDTLTLRDMSEQALRVLRHRRDIACVLVNPLQALHPNRGAPADSSLVDGRRVAGFDRVAYTEWLARLRAVCDQRGIALILDEVFLGFRLAPGGAQQYFHIRADLVTYGKTVAGGLPIGVVAGGSDWMRRFNPQHPADICFARGTFNSHSYVMAAMDEFLRALEGGAL
jgi:glutamate-1-semialdehyde 2,1-aminomutase